MKDIDWDDLRHFLFTARLGTASGAAQELGTSVSTVTRRITTLEKALGSQLFERSRRGYEPTEAGLRLLAYADRMEQDLRAAEDEIRTGDAEPKGVLRVACTESVAYDVLIPRLTAFHERYPRLRLELRASPATLSLGRGEADCAIRLSRPKEGDFVASRIGRMAFAYYTRAVAANQRGSVTPIVGWDRRLRTVASAQLLHPAVDSEEAPFTIDTGMGHLAAARHGAGPCLIACITGDRTDGLVRWPDTQVVGRYPVWFVVRTGLARLRRVRAFRAFVVDAFREEQAALEGADPSVSESR
ncbi:LysR family transcriptional regulator [Arhodomonas sp. SL1]|uniref:LysR family transcriptional regulator n=1 Tax=Arhodomonas sp. SL1 TaxID=3425691 RepID=UPI003F88375D